MRKADTNCHSGESTPLANPSDPLGVVQDRILVQALCPGLHLGPLFVGRPLLQALWSFRVCIPRYCRAHDVEGAIADEARGP